MIAELTSGIVQGSVMPLLFLIFINDLTNYLKKYRIIGDAMLTDCSSP